MTPRSSFVFVVLSTMLPGTVAVAKPRDELLRLVPENVHFCLLLQDLRAHLDDFAASPFLEAFNESPLGHKSRALPIDQPLGEVGGVLREHLGLSLKQLRDDFLGDAVVIAYRGGTVENPNREQGLILLWARKPDQLPALVEKINRFPDIRNVETIELNKEMYYSREHLGGDRDFLLVRGNVVAYANDESLIRELIQQPQNHQSALIARLEQLAVLDKLFVFCLNPRPFDELFEAQLSEVDGAEKAFLKHFQDYWAALDGVAFFLDLNQDLELGVSVNIRREDLPRRAQRFFADAGQPSALWKTIPDDALLAIAGRINVVALAETIGEFLTPEARGEVHDLLDKQIGALMGKDVLGRILTALGPDVGFWMSAPEGTEGGWFPEMIFALRIRSDSAGDEVEMGIRGGLNFVAFLVLKSYNNANPPEDHVNMNWVHQGKVQVTYFFNETTFPEGFRPAFALKGGYFVLAAAPGSIERFRPPPDPADDSLDGDGAPLLRISFVALRSYLETYRDVVIALMAKTNSITPEEADRRLDLFLGTLKLFQNLEIAQQVGKDRATWVLRVRTTKPLKPALDE